MGIKKRREKNGIIEHEINTQKERNMYLTQRFIISRM